MVDKTFTLTISGMSISELRTSFQDVGVNLLGLQFADDDPRGGRLGGSKPAEASPEPPEPSQDSLPAPATASTRRPRGRKAANGADAPAADATTSISEMRTQAVDILKACYAMEPDGAERVIHLQGTFNVKRFAEVPDARVEDLYKAAVGIQTALTDGEPAEADTGPF